MTLSKRQRTALLVLLPLEEIKEKQKHIPKNQTPLWKHWQSFVTRQLDLGRSPVTLKSVQSGIRVILRYTKILSVEQANTAIFVSDQLLCLQKDRGYSASTRNTYIKNLNSYMIWLEKRGFISSNNLRKAEKSTLSLQEQPIQNKQQIEQVLLHITTKKYHNKIGRLRDLLFVWLLVFTGARTCELIGMKCDDCYDSKDGWQIRIAGRKQKSRIRYYQMPQHIKEIYLQYIVRREALGYSCSALFVSLKNRGPISVDGIKKFFQRIYKETGLKFSGHRVRRYVATRLNDEKFSMIEIARYLGHQRTSTTELYIARTGSLTASCSRFLADEFHL